MRVALNAPQAIDYSRSKEEIRITVALERADETRSADQTNRFGSDNENDETRVWADSGERFKRERPPRHCKAEDPRTPFTERRALGPTTDVEGREASRNGGRRHLY